MANPIKMFNRHVLSPLPLCSRYRACRRNNTMTNWIGVARVTEESKMDFMKSTDNNAVHMFMPSTAAPHVTHSYGCFSNS